LQLQRGSIFGGRKAFLKVRVRARVFRLEQILLHNTRVVEVISMRVKIEEPALRGSKGLELLLLLLLLLGVMSEVVQARVTGSE